MKILIAPLNWGLGHAARCVPLIRHYLEQGDEVVLAGDGDSFTLLKRTFPDLRTVDLPPLVLRYTANSQQRGFYLRAVWTLMRFTIADHYYLRQILAREDGYPWLNLLALRGVENIWERYGIRGAGEVFLIDRDGTILAVGATAEEVEQILKERL